MAKSINLGTGLLCFLGFWLVLCVASYFTWAAFSVTQFEYPRSAYEAQQVYGLEFACDNASAACVAPGSVCDSSTPGVCPQLCDNNAYSLRWFWMQSHHLHIVFYVIFAAFFLWTLAVDLSTVATVLVALLGFTTLVVSVAGYLWNTTACALDTCGYSSCPFSFKELGLSASATPSGYSTAYWIYLIVVPLMNLWTFLSSIVAIYAYNSLRRNLDKANEKLSDDEETTRFIETVAPQNSMAPAGSSQSRIEDLLNESPTPAPVAFRTRSRNQRPLSR